jgi:hypothetical protein
MQMNFFLLLLMMVVVEACWGQQHKLEASNTWFCLLEAVLVVYLPP